MSENMKALYLNYFYPDERYGVECGKIVRYYYSRQRGIEEGFKVWDFDAAKDRAFNVLLFMLGRDNE